MQKFLWGLLGAIVGAITALIAATCGAAFASGGNSLGAGFLLVLLAPFGLVVGAIVGAIAGNRLRRRVTGDLASAKFQAKCWYVGRIVASVIAIDVTMGYAFIHSNDPPSDRVLIANFARHEQTFNQIVQMLQKDKGLTRVDENWYADKENSHSEEPAPPRIQEYRGLLHAIDTPRGISADEQHREIDFLYWLVGSAISSDTTKGYVYTEKPPVPLLLTLDGYRPERNRLRVYRHIKGNWYLFYEYLPG